MTSNDTVGTEEYYDSKNMENFCDDCGKPIRDCPFWIQTIENMEEIKKGNFKTYTLEEYIKYLHSEEEKN